MEVEPIDEQKRSFVAVYIPPLGNNPTLSECGDTQPQGGVFTDFKEALRVAKQNKGAGARFKQFSTEEAALAYATFGTDSLTTPCSPGGDAHITMLKGEESPPFPGPSRPQLSKLKKTIENCDGEHLRNLLLENPRYLVNCSGDTPTIVFEGCRYNALHLACKAGNLDACQLVLALITDSEYLSQLYPSENCEEMSEMRKSFLLDLYLNTPDKSLNETPLHFASKLGHVDIVKTLTSISVCDKHIRNKYGETAADMACAKAKIGGKGRLERAQKEILDCLEQTPMYVPLYRSMDFSSGPQINSPVSGCPDMQIPSPTNLRTGRLGGALYLAAVAGPLNSARARDFHAQWTSKSARCTLPVRTPARSSAGAAQATPTTPAAFVKRSDLHKGMERVGRHLAAQFNCDWTEYWAFLGCFTDLRTDSGLQLLEQYLKQKMKSSRSPDDSPANPDEYSSPAFDFGTPITLNCSGQKAHNDLNHMTLMSPNNPLCSPINNSGSFRRLLSGRSRLQQNLEDTPERTRLNFDEDNADRIDDDATQDASDIFEDSFSVLPESSQSVDNSDHSERDEPIESDMSLLALQLAALSLDLSASANQHTADQDSANEDEEEAELMAFGTPPNTPETVYLMGNKPSKTDLDVLLALEDFADTENAVSFPKVRRWIKIMGVFSEKERADWPATSSPRFLRDF